MGFFTSMPQNFVVKSAIGSFLKGSPVKGSLFTVAGQPLNTEHRTLATFLVAAIRVRHVKQLSVLRACSAFGFCEGKDNFFSSFFHYEIHFIPLFKDNCE